MGNCRSQDKPLPGIECGQRANVDAVLRGFTDVVCATVAKGDPVVITGFAKFAKIQTKARMGRNPATGAAIKIKAPPPRSTEPDLPSRAGPAARRRGR